MERSIAVPRLIWAALVFSNLMYGLVLVTQFKDQLAAPFPSTHILVFPLMVIALMALAIAMILPKALFMKAKAKFDASAVPPTDQQIMQSFFAPWIIRMALLESISIYGFLLAMMTQAPIAFVPFGALSILTQLSQYPTPQRVRDMLGIRT